MFKNLPPWEALLKKILFLQLGDIQGKKILDFGSGMGFTASFFAQNNEVVAIEPAEEALQERCTDHPYTQLVGSTELLKEMAD